MRSHRRRREIVRDRVEQKKEIGQNRIEKRAKSLKDILCNFATFSARRELVFLEIQGFLRNRGRLHRWCHRWYFIHHLCLGQNLRVQEAHLGRRKPQRRSRAFGPRTPCRDTESVREERENGADVADRILISSSTSLSQKCTSYVCVCVCVCVCVRVCVYFK